MVKTRIYVEGGGDNKALKIRCREAFSKFFEKAGFKGHMPAVDPCGARQNAYDDFCIALGRADSDNLVILLVDSEGPVEQGQNCWQHLRSRPDDNWSRPSSASDNHAHLMVQCMESWFMADQFALSDYYGQGFQKSALPKNPSVENIPKNDVLTGLKNSTRGTQKGKYDKADHSFAILSRIDPEKVKKSAPHAKRLLDFLEQQLLGQ